MVGLGLVLLGAYLLGSVPTGALVGRAHGVDLTRVGSQRTGATNALRLLGKRAATLVLLGDVAKGLIVVLLARRLGGRGLMPPLAALAAMVGHTHSIFLGGRGGRGVATGLGALLALSPRGLATGAMVSGIAIAASRYVSLGSLLGALSAAAWMIGEVAARRAPRAHVVFALGGAAFLIYSHRDNVARLLAGTERRLGERSVTE